MHVALDVENIKAFLASLTDEQEESYASPRDKAYDVLQALLSYCRAHAGTEAAGELANFMYDLEAPRRAEAEAWLESFRQQRAADLAEAKRIREEFIAAHPNISDASFQATWNTPVDDAIGKKTSQQPTEDNSK